MPTADPPDHAEYVALQRKRVGEVAADILDGKVNILEGARLLVSLHHEVEVEEDDPDFVAMVTIESETAELPAGAERKDWSLRGLTRNIGEISKAEAWANDLGLEACRNLVRRFGAA
ncbi:MAG: DUF2489 domain-containing protein [Thermoanaerobaculia bacterium]